MQYGNSSTRVLLRFVNTRGHVYVFINRRHAFMLKNTRVRPLFQVGTPYSRFHACKYALRPLPCMVKTKNHAWFLRRAWVMFYSVLEHYFAYFKYCILGRTFQPGWSKYFASISFQEFNQTQRDARKVKIHGALKLRCASGGSFCHYMHARRQKTKIERDRSGAKICRNLKGRMKKVIFCKVTRWTRSAERIARQSYKNAFISFLRKLHTKFIP